jgi:hypothetical protein
MERNKDILKDPDKKEYVKPVVVTEQTLERQILQTKLFEESDPDCQG